VSKSIREQFVHLTEDLNKFNVPTLIIHGDDNHIVAIANSALRSATIIPNATRKIYEVYSHGIATTHKDRINQDLLAFIKE
jgi:non-heme chloroperoxidase